MIVELGEPQQQFTLEVRLTSRCNYNCYYCTDLHNNKNSITLLNPENVCSVIKSISSTLKLPIHLFIYGGEPTLYPHLTDFLDKVLDYIVTNKINVFVEVQTNLSRTNSWLLDFCKRYAKYNTVLKISGSYHNGQTSIIPFIKKCLIIKSNDLLNKVTFMYNKRKCVMHDFNTAVSVLGIQYCEISPLIDNRVDQSSSDTTELQHIQNTENIDELARHSFFFKKNIKCITSTEGSGYTSRFELWSSNKNEFLGYTCNVAKERLVIDWDGNCYKCFNEMFANIKPVFNINDTVNYDEYFTKVVAVVCPFRKCFFDLEHKKTKQNTVQIPAELNAKYGTKQYRQ